MSLPNFQLFTSKLCNFQVNRGLEDKQAQTQQEFQSIREENRSLRNKVEVENESLRLAAEVNTVNREYFVSKIFHAIIFHVK